MQDESRAWNTSEALLQCSAMRRRRTDRFDWPPEVTPSSEDVRQARALAEHLSEGGELPVAPVPDLYPGEVGHAFWPTGFHAAVYAPYRGSPYVPPAQGWFIADPRRYGVMAAAGTLLGRTPKTRPKGRYWQPVAGGHPIALAITSTRLWLGIGDSVTLAVGMKIRSDESGCALQIDAGTSVICIWGKHCPYAAVVLDHLAAGGVSPRLRPQRQT
jgi:hypothetical protein